MAIKGHKDDSGKMQWRLMPFECLQEVMKVLMFGMQKYGPYNWQRVPQAKDRYFDAAMRHLLAYRQGEKADKETGVSHLAHLICCGLFLLWFDIKEKK